MNYYKGLSIGHYYKDWGVLVCDPQVSQLITLISVAMTSDPTKVVCVCLCVLPFEAI